MSLLRYKLDIIEPASNTDYPIYHMIEDVAILSHSKKFYALLLLSAIKSWTQCTVVLMTWNSQDQILLVWAKVLVV